MSQDRDDETRPSIKVRLNGPLRVRGDVVLYDHNGTEIETPGDDFVLCRCGRTGSAPFCDGSHRECDEHTRDP